MVITVKKKKIKTYFQSNVDDKHDDEDDDDDDEVFKLWQL